jgi:hypothetical protein
MGRPALTKELNDPDRTIVFLSMLAIAFEVNGLQNQ